MVHGQLRADGGSGPYINHRRWQGSRIELQIESGATVRRGDGRRASGKRYTYTCPNAGGAKEQTLCVSFDDPPL